MATINRKDRNIFAFKQFRGLDRENKPSKVAPYRAVDGKNFFINSETLKTRPAFKYNRKTHFFLNDDYIIDWYKFNNITFYVTKKHFYVETPEQSYFNEQSSDSNIIKEIFSEFNFENLTPFFVEEKKCLFIFGLNNIYVFSIIKNPLSSVNSYYVLYSLNSKPQNPFAVTNSFFYNAFDELPTAYVPTLMIGKNSYEDVNLLSNKVKYKVFAETNDSYNGKNIIHRLPTHYNPKIHGTYDKNITFYNGRFNDNSIIPVFVGIKGENFANEADFGTVYNSTTPIQIQTKFYPAKQFEYYGTSGNVSSIISEIYGVSKNMFFNSIEEITGKTVFEYLLNLINTSNFLTNQLIKFALPIVVNSWYRDATTNNIMEVVVEEKSVDVFVQLKKYEDVDYALAGQKVYSSEKVRQLPEASYPAYPEIDETPAPTLPTFDLSATPINVLNFDEEKFTELCVTFMEQKRHDPTVVDNSVIRINAKLYYGEDVDIEQKIENHNDINTWIKSDSSMNITWDDSTTFPSYPQFEANSQPIIEITPIVSKTGSGFIFTNLDFRHIYININIYMNEHPEEFLDSGWGFAKVRFQTTWEEFGRTWIQGISVVVPFSYVKGYHGYYEYRQCFSFVATVDKSVTVAPIVNSLYTFVFNEKDNCFELKIKDYFFDYNLEPSIEVEVSFGLNPDYDIISKSKFGTIFGSENRIFLAGNETYPNIDRYNVSNNLLGMGVENQSYETTYFPSKNYRILGGKGAINGYVVATDTQLYVTKEEFFNDQKLFIRERNIDDNGAVLYKEYRTNINVTPLNNRCIINFNNDIVLLSKSGLYAIEISSNVLTNERLKKLRSSFINKDIVKAIKDFNNQKEIFICESDGYMFIVIDKNVYVADSRYVMKNDNNEYDNYAYEIVKWESPLRFKVAKQEQIDNVSTTIFLDCYGKIFYSLSIEPEDYDDKTSYYENSAGVTTAFQKDVIVATLEIDNLLVQEGIASFTFDDVFVKFADLNDYTISENTVSIIDEFAFENLKNGDNVAFRNRYGLATVFEVSEKTESGFQLLYGVGDANYDTDEMYLCFSRRPLYISTVFDYNINDEYDKLYSLSSTMVSYEIKEKSDEETYESYLARISSCFEDSEKFIFVSSGLQNVFINFEKKIETIWISAVTDFGNNIMEKTMFSVNIYATKQNTNCQIYFGYKTMRKNESITETIPLPSNFNFENISFENFALSSFNEFGMSIKKKENNFLYIQFLIIGSGAIELNSIEILYKLNRYLKTIG